MIRNTGSRGLFNLLRLSPEDVQSHPEWKPTESIPGSEEKMLVMQRRIEMGLPIFHPEDRGTRDMRWHHDIDEDDGDLDEEES